MKSSLSYLPTEKRKELRLITSVIRELANVEMIILFGSYARGDWRDEYWTGQDEFNPRSSVTYEYHSDYDILIVVREKKSLKNGNIIHHIEAYIREQMPVITPTHIMAYTVDSLNQKIEQGDPFFTDVKRDGVWLYNSRRCTLARRRQLDPAERQGIAKKDFRLWQRTANNFWDDCKNNVTKRRYKQAAFHLHQATEYLYTTMLQVFAQHRPRTHNIERLGKRAASQDARLGNIFPRNTQAENDRFDLLKRAYIEARYNPQYKITRKDLDCLVACVKKLRTLTRKICREKIAEFK